MQIASGWSKGLKILTPKGLDTRPTRERVRASALNMLQPWIKDAAVVDLFAGSGAVGLELLSRGAISLVLVENGTEALACLKANVSGLLERAGKQSLNLDAPQIFNSDAGRFLAKPERSGSADLIWADPPYSAVASFLEQATPSIARALRTEGVFALECQSGDEAIVESFTRASGLVQVKQRRYGVTLITIWQKPS